MIGDVIRKCRLSLFLVNIVLVLLAITIFMYFLSFI